MRGAMLLSACVVLGGCARRTGPAVAEPVPAFTPDSHAEALSLLGQPLVTPTLSAETRERLEKNLADARAAYAAKPDADATIWLGRRTAYLGHYREAIDIFSRGIREFPSDARLYRHRGHRYITVREFDKAIADFTKAAQLIRGRPDEVEPDGQPNARNIPTSTLQSNIWYHLGLAYYLIGDFASASDAYAECMKVSKNDDMKVATSHWLYMTERRLRHATAAAEVLAPITPNMDVHENQSYHRLLLLYKGLLPVDSLLAPSQGTDNPALNDATVGYGVGNWHYYNGRTREAADAFARVLRGGQWASFGYIASEVDLRNIEQAQSRIRR